MVSPNCLHLDGNSNPVLFICELNALTTTETGSKICISLQYSSKVCRTAFLPCMSVNKLRNLNERMCLTYFNTWYISLSFIFTFCKRLKSDRASFLSVSGEMSHDSQIVASSLGIGLTSLPFKSFIIICYRFSKGFRSGIFFGQSFI